MTETKPNLMESPMALAPNWTAPESFAQAAQMASMIANSGLCPKSFRNQQSDVLVAMMFGSELGLSPMASLQNIAVINGRPTIWGDAQAGVCMARPDYDGMDVDEADPFNVTVTVRRRLAGGRVQESRGHFSKAKALAAGLWTKEGPWKQYPERMVFVRARALALRNAFPDVLSGLPTAEVELDIERDAEFEIRDQDVGEAIAKAQEATLNVDMAKKEPLPEAAPASDKPTYSQKTSPGKNNKRPPQEGDTWVRTGDNVRHVRRNGLWIPEGSSFDKEEQKPEPLDVCEPMPADPDPETAARQAEQNGDDDWADHARDPESL